MNDTMESWSEEVSIQKAEKKVRNVGDQDPVRSQ